MNSPKHGERAMPLTSGPTRYPKPFPFSLTCGLTPEPFIHSSFYKKKERKNRCQEDTRREIRIMSKSDLMTQDLD